MAARAKKKTSTPKKKAKRTVMYSRSGKKLYAKRSKTGQFKDIQSYKRAHGADLKRKSKAEKAAAATKKKKAKKKSKAKPRTSNPKAAAAKRVATHVARKEATAAARSYAIAPKPAVDGEAPALLVGDSPVEVPAAAD